MAELTGKKLTASIIVSLLAIGALSYNALPEAYCPLEDSTAHYIRMTEDKKTITKVLPTKTGEEWSVIDDRCQKGTKTGEWIPLVKESIKTDVLVVGYVTDCASGQTKKYFCDGVGEGHTCFEDNELHLPIE